MKNEAHSQPADSALVPVFFRRSELCRGRAAGVALMGHGVTQSVFNSGLSLLSPTLRESTPRGRADSSAPMEAPPPTPPPTVLSDR